MLAQSEDNPTGIPEETLQGGANQLVGEVGAWLAVRSAGYWGIADDVAPLLMDWTRRQIMDTSVHILLERSRAFTYCARRARREGAAAGRAHPDCTRGRP